MISSNPFCMAKKSTPTKTVTMIRDAGTGRLVTKSYAEKHPKTTVVEKRKVK